MFHHKSKVHGTVAMLHLSGRSRSPMKVLLGSGMMSSMIGTAYWLDIIMDVNIAGRHPNSTWSSPWQNSRLPVRTRKGLEKKCLLQWPPRFCHYHSLISGMAACPETAASTQARAEDWGCCTQIRGHPSCKLTQQHLQPAFRLTINRTSSHTSHKSESSLLEIRFVKGWKRALKQYNPIITKFSQKLTSPLPDSWVPCPVNGPKGAGDWVPQSWSAKLDNKVLLSYTSEPKVNKTIKLNDVLYKPAISLMYFLQIASNSHVFRCFLHLPVLEFGRKSFRKVLVW